MIKIASYNGRQVFRCRKGGRTIYLLMKGALLLHVYKQGMAIVAKRRALRDLMTGVV